MKSSRHTARESLAGSAPGPDLGPAEQPLLISLQITEEPSCRCQSDRLHPERNVNVLRIASVATAGQRFAQKTRQ